MRKELDNFCVQSRRDMGVYKKYEELCKKHNILYSEGWNGSGTYYGIKEGTRMCASNSWGKVFNTITEFQLYVEGVENYKIY